MAGDMESNNSSVLERGAGKNKRKWTEEEDEKLVEALMELVNTGKFKADNGFKPGYLTFLESSLQTKLPTARIKGKPHIESRMKTLKKDFSAVYDISYGANSSGFGWNAEDNVVTAPRDVWVQYLKVHPGAAKWQNTAMPSFKELSVIFGKDRATGNMAENLEDVVEELNTEAADELSLQEDLQRSTHSDESTSKKRKKGNVESLLEAVYAASDRIANQFEASTKLLIAAEEDMMQKKKQLNDELSKIPNLTVLQKLQVAKKIAKDEDLMILFFAAPAEEKIIFVHAVLDNQI
ncbi:hypothetical protein DCAR_0101294 [Daucus carota subsp. sativus]|uniref:Myb/SANT-like domain-containing protein n=1 Tax=Daucus carota subsp. sativus TaxID=79200 RepID=A0AAF0W2K3_DAUCS|nr:PREDICTED: uncharacterized protein At2g29880-like [Daucus carota subsp. sativus]XP_017237484.1 PREDICTED: uncharacterized protein At2g29880-like [Daucus carota subsp. sativus]XP_017237493.1 PREDICTED: uncharacterized protein At2g29880-like [Daucus carota subsp. sativus]XP_017237502.1 PREDICTED: uncharacterized protein At2g29880-like [Daucus carota subsp. sativus]WOG82132.1 hypothetical protein DCAR_0101294 [Daucus carota subsp. sativus]